MVNPDRRLFIQNTIAGMTLGVGDTLLNRVNGLSRLALAQSIKNIPGYAESGPLIVVFQRGAADGLAILSPLNDPDFNAARPPEMSFSKTSSSGKIESSGTDFFWHPQAGHLAQLFESKKLLAWQAVGIKNETRSHFEAQEMVERGASSLAQLTDRLGWMARESRKKNLSDAEQSFVHLYGGSNNLPRALQGVPGVLSVRDLQSGIAIPNGDAGLRAILTLSQAESTHPSARFIDDQMKSISTINELLPKGKGNKTLPYSTAGKTSYLNNDPSVGLRSLAQLLELKIPIRYAWIDQLGWDTHENQPGRIHSLIQNLGHGLTAFAEDMQARKQPYTLVIMTEFGRRLRSNRSNGTDHGHGSLAMVMGSRIPGGQVLGRWPGLSSVSLDRQVDLAVTTDYLEVLRQSMSWHAS